MRVVPDELEKLEADAEPERRFAGDLQRRRIPQEAYGSVHRRGNLQGASSGKRSAFRMSIDRAPWRTLATTNVPSTIPPECSMFSAFDKFAAFALATRVLDIT